MKEARKYDERARLDDRIPYCIFFREPFKALPFLEKFVSHVRPAVNDGVFSATKLGETNWVSHHSGVWSVRKTGHGFNLYHTDQTTRMVATIPTFDEMIEELRQRW